MNAIVDTGVWYAMFDDRDPRHPEGKKKAELLDLLDVVVPWPTVYETLRTKFVKKQKALQQFETFLKRPNIAFLPDQEFLEDAFALCLESSVRGRRPLSMTDCLIRLIVDDINTRIDYLATFNLPDFIDICGDNGVEII